MVKTANIFQSKDHKARSFSSRTSEKQHFFRSHKNTSDLFFNPAVVQPKLRIGQPNNKYEQEADRVADSVMNIPDPKVQRESTEEEEELQMQALEKEEELQMKCKECENEDYLQTKHAIQTKEGRSNYVSQKVSGKIHASKGSGNPLPADINHEMSTKIGVDFSNVSVHTNSRSEQLNRVLGARAFTVGSDIFFNRNEYSPESSKGKHLLAHELTHVVQQGADAPGVQKAMDDKHNLTAALFSGELKLEDTFDGEDTVQLFDKGPPVKKLQQGLMQLGFHLPSGDDGEFGGETQRAVIDFQSSSGLTGMDLDGIVGKKTMGLLDVAVRHGKVATDIDVASEDFRVKGKFEEEEGKKKDKNPAKIYFDLASAEVDSEEQDKIEEIAEKHRNDPLTLIGYASEEGTAVFNRQLAGRRVDAVDDRFTPIHDSLRILENNAEAGEGKIDYRSFRSVEVLTPGEKTAHQSCKGKSKDKACPVPNTPLNAAIDTALKIIQKVKDEQLPPKKTKDSDYNAIFSSLFRNNDQRPLQNTVKEVKEIYNKVAAHITDLKNNPALQRCGSECDGGCAAGSPAYNRDTNGNNSAGRLTMCDSFFDESAELKAIIIIHEGHHGTPGIPSSDIAYQDTRLIDKLDHTKALQNAASFHIYAQLVNNPNSTNIGPEKEDIVNITDVKQKEQFNLSLAFIEQWFTLNTFDTSTLHAGIHETRQEGRWEEGNAKTLMEHYFAPRFGFTRPPAIPPKKDQTDVAAIYDRLTTMEKAFSKPLTINENQQHEQWERGPGQKIDVTSRILSLDQQRQVIALVQELVHATPDISARLEPEYVILINDLRKGRKLDP